MKKFLLMAVAAMGLLFTACSKDEVAQSVAEKSTVTFTVATPELSTRAHGDGESATALAYAVYNRADNALLFQGTKTMTNLTATVEIPFVNGMTYDVLFWAAAPESPYTVDWDAKTVGYTNAAALVGNSEKYDAFYYFLTGDELPEITGPVTKTVELKRPFAQLNIKTNDAKEAKQSGVEVKDVKVVVKNGYSSFDLAAGAGKDKNDVTFGFAAKQENANAEGVQLLAVNYLFTGGEKSLVDVEFTYTDVNGKVAAAGEVMEFAAVPVQRNYRTNIVGSLLTSDGKFNIETKPGFDGTHDHNVVTATPEDINTIIRKPEVTTVELGAGEYSIELYNLDKKKTLTINGTEGTKIKFEDLQVRASQFDELVINNCEILRMPEKSWGHLVFGASNNANGVYTISNCTFNGVGSQGIYINETVSGVTYNILNCTFNGDFGREGAVTIQNNDGVDHIVNILGCTFNNIPSTSHLIYLHYDYMGFTLNTDIKAATNADIKSLIDTGFETINVADGNYSMAEIGDLQGKTLTIVGSKNAVIDASTISANNQFVTGTTLAFEGVTINFGTVNYMGFANPASLTYTDCDINGLQFLYGTVKFDNCNLNSNGAEHCVWTYGANNVEFKDCDFTYSDRCVNHFKDQPLTDATISYEGCTFTTTNALSNGAVEINSSSYTNGINVNLTGCTAPAYGKMVYISEWDPTAGKTATVTVDGVEVPYAAINAKALENAINAGLTTITVDGEIDLAGVNLTNFSGTIIGAEGASLSTRNFTPGSDEAYQLGYTTNITFKNLDILLPTERDWIQSGFVCRGTIVFDNCDFEGQATLNGSGTWVFNECDFVSTESDVYASFVYGAAKATFNTCTFSGVDRAAKVYGTGGNLDVEYNTCSFTSSTLNKSGVEIDASYATTVVNLNGCSQTAMAGLYALKGSKGTVYVDGNQQ